MNIFRVMAVKWLFKLQLLSWQIFLKADLQGLIYCTDSVLSPEKRVTRRTQQQHSNSKLSSSAQTRQRRARNRSISTTPLQAVPYCQRSLHSLSHPSHSLEVTQEQFVKLFFFPRQSLQELEFAPTMRQWADGRACWGLLLGQVRPRTLVLSARWVSGLEESAGKFYPKLQQQSGGAHSVQEQLWQQLTADIFRKRRLSWANIKLLES